MEARHYLSRGSGLVAAIPLETVADVSAKTENRGATST